jgi:hypothetical protein
MSLIEVSQECPLGSELSIADMADRYLAVTWLLVTFRHVFTPSCPVPTRHPVARWGATRHLVKSA